MAEALTDPSWALLREFVARWYRDPLAVTNDDVARFDGLGPPALKTWFLLAGERLEPERSFLYFPNPELFAAWPALPKTSRLLESHRELGLLPLIELGGHGGWAVSVAAPGADPPVRPLMDEDQESPEFPGPLSALLTQAVILETLTGGLSAGPTEGVLGPLAPGVRRLEQEDLTPNAVALLRSERFTPIPGWGLEAGDTFRSDPEQTTLIHDAGTLSVLTRTEAAARALDDLIRRHEAALEEERAQERARHDAQKVEALAALDGVPATGPELLAALEAIEPRLLRFQRAFLDDFRRLVRVGSAPSALLLKAGQILQERRA